MTKQNNGKLGPHNPGEHTQHAAPPKGVGRIEEPDLAGLIGNLKSLDKSVTKSLCIVLNIFPALDQFAAIKRLPLGRKIELATKIIVAHAGASAKEDFHPVEEHLLAVRFAEKALAAFGISGDRPQYDHRRELRHAAQQVRQALEFWQGEASSHAWHAFHNYSARLNAHEWI